MGDNSFTPADWAAMNNGRDNDCWFGGGGFFGIIVLFFIFALFGGGGLWGNNATQGALTRAELTDGFNTQDILRNQSQTQQNLFDVQKEILQNRFTGSQDACTTQREIMESRFTTQLGFQSTQAQEAQNCCDIKTAIHAEAEATRALINANTMQELRDNLQAAQLQLGNLSQTNTLLAAINKTPMPAYITASPYQSAYNPYAQGCLA